MKEQSLDALGIIEPPAMPEPVLPHIVHKGKYTLWEKPDGTLRIQYHRDDKDDEDFIEIPGQLLRIAQMLSEGKMNPLAALKAMRGMNGGEL